MKSVNETIDNVREASNPWGYQDASKALQWVKANCNSDLYDEMHDMLYMDTDFKPARLVCILVEMLKELK